ncbi:MAG: dicarboxylate/amino acid:cation symporter [Gallicola sp.]|nr:dicarboxylate/amino acid:cation symporter [Gallicola sp.]
MEKILALIVTVVLFFVLRKLQKKEVPFTYRILLATALGIGVGILFRGNTEYVKGIGTIYVNLLKAIVVPLLLFSIIATVLSLENINRLKTIGAKTIGFLSLQNVLASILAITVALILRLGTSSDLGIPVAEETREVPTLVDTFIGFFPSNIVESAMNNQILPIIIFALLIGLAIISYKGDKIKIEPFVKFIQAGNEVIFSLIGIITNFTQYAVLALIAGAVNNLDLSAVGPVLLVLLGVYIAGIIHSNITAPLVVGLVAKVSPITFIRKFFPVQSVAFSTQSSVGTIPVHVKTLEKMGVPEKVGSFVASIGTTVGMPGCAAIWPVLLALFTVNTLGIQYTLVDYLILILVALAVSLGTVGVPGTATITATALFATIGLPIEMIILMEPISAIADMMRTSTNVTSAGASAVVVAKLEGVLDEELYNSDSKTERPEKIQEREIYSN